MKKLLLVVICLLFVQHLLSQNVVTHDDRCEMSSINEMSLSLFANPKFIVERDSTKIYAYVTNANDEVIYDWSPKEFLIQSDSSVVMAFPKESTTFKLTVTCGSQSVTDSVRIDVLSTPDDFTAYVHDDDVYLQWDKVETAEIYRVRRNGETIINYLDTTAFVDKDIPDGIYCYTVIAVKYAYTSPETKEICVEVLGLPETDDDEIDIYPNPANNKLNINAENLKSISIYDVMGQMIFYEDVDFEDNVVDLSDFNSGMYILQLNINCEIVTKKINIVK